MAHGSVMMYGFGTLQDSGGPHLGHQGSQDDGHRHCDGICCDLATLRTTHGVEYETPLTYRYMSQ
jgi:hypothetical protein